MNNQEETKILKDMEKHGFPLEIRASEILKAHNWRVRNQAAYIDSERELHRTIDITATREILRKPTELAFDLLLVAECKKNTKPWVFYVSDFNMATEDNRSRAVIRVQYYIFEQAYQSNLDEKIRSVMVDRFSIDSRLRPPTFETIGHIPFEPYSNGKLRSIYKAQMQVCNSILFLQEDLGRVNFPIGTVFLPMIVFDGQLYTYDNKKLKPAKGLYYEVDYQDSIFMIEIVTIDYLEDYMTALDAKIKAFQDSWNQR